MDIHKNARLTLRSREQLVQFVLSGQTLSAAARRFLVTPKTAAKWVQPLSHAGLRRARRRFLATAPQSTRRTYRRRPPPRPASAPRFRGPTPNTGPTLLKGDQFLQPWTHYYNHQRPHGSLNYKPPISRSDSGTTS